MTFGYLSFRMQDSFFDAYRDRRPEWGFPAGAGNTLGELSWITKYARQKDDGTRERFWEGLRRAIEGMYSIQKDHALAYKLPWSDAQAQRSAQEAYERCFAGKWSPPGRGLWMMGTPMVNEKKDSSALQNCAFISTVALADDPILPFTRMMDMSMLGVGVGFDVLGAGKVALHDPQGYYPHQVGDSREGWCESLGCLLRAFFTGSRLPNFDYSRVRPEGSPIRGFGGVASGPAPLEKLHRQVIALLSGRAGQVLTSSDITDIMNMAGKCVVSANVRRSAQIALGPGDDDEFLDLKDWNKNPVRMGADGWGHLSNNSVIANSGDDLSHLASRIALNGEPGVFWRDIARRYGRLADSAGDPHAARDYRVMGVNPCQPAWATLLTPEGIATMGEIEPGDTVWSQDGWVRVTRKTATGVKPVYRYRTTAGYVDATENHRVVSGGVKTELQDAQTVDRLRGGLGATGHDAKDVLAGLLLGDGYVHVTNGNPYHVLCIGENDQDYFTSEVAHLIIARHGKDNCFRTEATIEEQYLSRLPERRIPRHLLANASVLRGLFSANGSIVRGRVTLKTTSAGMRDDVQLSLSAFGIASYYTVNRPSVIKWPNGEYESRESFDLNIGRARDVRRFADIIGFIQAYKNDKLEAMIRTDDGRPDKSFDITEAEFLGDHEVWDITVDGGHHTYWSGGMNVSNCGEQPLEHMELCTLVETFPSNCDNLPDYLRTLKFAYLYAKTVTLLMTRWPQTNEVMIRNRRIGTSMTGIAQFAEKHGWSELRRWQDKGYAEIRRWDRIYSEWLGVRESVKVTTVKPSGTVSLLFGVTPGAHWPKERGFYVRTIRDIRDSPFAKAMQAAGYPVEPSISDPETTVVISLPVEGPDVRPEREVSIWEKASLAATCQRWWSDNAVSVTLTFREDEAGQIPAVLRAFDGQLKSASFLPDAEGVYAQAPYQRVPKEQWDALRAGIKPVDWDSLYGDRALPDAEGEMYCTTDACEIRT